MIKLDPVQERGVRFLSGAIAGLFSRMNSIPNQFEIVAPLINFKISRSYY